MIRRPSNPNGFTLLETLLAVTVLAAMTGLVAVMWSQVNAWSADASMERETLRVHRVVRLMQDQWQDRRSAVEFTESRDDFISTEVGLGFVTATPILFPDWPLVSVSYTIERDIDAPSGVQSWDLVYRERRIVSFGPQLEDAKARWDSTGEPMRDAIVLLDGCPELAFERFGAAADARGDRPATPGDDVNDDDDRAIDPLSEDAAEQAAAAGLTDEELQAAAALRWRPRGDYDGPILALRLVGVHQERRFACVFPAKALR